jgi:transaldolase
VAARSEVQKPVSKYLARVKAETSSRFWINNPTRQEAAMAIDAGAVGCTTNPAYMAGLTRRNPDEILPTIRARSHEEGSDRVIADRVQLDLVARIAKIFEDVHLQSDGRLGFVSIQGAPDTDDDPEVIIREALEARRVGPNVVPKIPATAPGLAALGEIVARGHPCIVTEVFSIAQLVAVSERHVAASLGSVDRPPLFISPITGIFGDHLRVVADDLGLTVDRAVIARVGVLLARACQRVVIDRGYEVTLLAGGARTTTDLTDLVGGGMHATINYSTVEELEALDPPVAETIGAQDPRAVVDTLVATFDSVRIALDPGALAEADFASFPPLLYFREIFAEGWSSTMEVVASERATMNVSSSGSS